MVLRVRKLRDRLATKTGRLLCVLLVWFGAVPSNTSRWRRGLLRLQNVEVRLLSNLQRQINVGCPDAYGYR
jgi:hypothetical protein